jgi:hypothetical protein
MKNTSKVINKFKCKTKYNKRIKYFKLPLIDNKDTENKYDIDTINIQSFEIISKQDLFMGLILFSGVIYFMF